MKYIIEYDTMAKKKIVEIEADDPRKAKYVAYKTLVKDGIFDNKLRFMNFYVIFTGRSGQKANG